jgi:hypothetical protein
VSPPELTPGLLLDAALGALPADRVHAVRSALDLLAHRGAAEAGSLVSRWREVLAPDALGSSAGLEVVPTPVGGREPGPGTSGAQGAPASALALRALLLTGDLAASRPAIEESLAFAAAAGSRVEPTALAGLAWIDWWDGDGDAALERLARATLLLGQPGSAATGPVLVHGFSGLVQARLGSADDAAASFSAARASTAALGWWASALVAALMAEASSREPRLESVSLPSPLDRSTPLGAFVAVQFRLARAHRALLDARWSDAVELATEDELSVDRLGRARAQVIEAQGLHALGDELRAEHRIEGAIHEFEELGATAGVVQALLVAARFAGPMASDRLAEADRRSGSSPALDRLWRDGVGLHLQVLGGRSVRGIAGEVAMSDRVAQLVLALVLADGDGVHWETVASWLWPDEWDDKKLKSRVTSTTNLARKALGPDGWRLQRDGVLLRFARRGLEVDLFEVSEARGDEPVDLEALGGLLPEWSALEWVQEAAQRWGGSGPT